MSVTSRLKHGRIDSAAVVAHQYAQPAGSVFELNLDALGVRMTECVNQSLPANAIDFIPKHRVQRAWLAVYDHTKADVVLNGEFLLSPRKRLFQVQRAALGRA